MKLFGNRRHGGEHTGHAGHTEHTSDLTDAEIDVSEIRSDETGDGAEASAEASGPARKRAMRRLLIIAGCVVAVLGVVVGAYFIWEKPLQPTSQDPVNVSAPPRVTPTKKPDVSAPPEDEPGEDEDPEDTEGALALPVTAGRRDGVFTFLLVGTDRASNSTDTIIVASFDTKEKTINCVNIPRDTLINISWATTPKKVNAVYPGYFNTYKGNPGRYEEEYGSAEGYGVYGLREHIRKMLGFYVDYYVLVDIQAVEDLVDAIGGVEFDVPEDMFYYDPAQDLAIEIYAGRQVLDGENAVKLCRFRNTYAAGDLKRIEVQQSFLKTLARQLISAKSIPHLGELLDIVEREVDTDLAVANVAWLVRQFLGCSMDDITFQTAPLAPGSTGINNTSFVGVEPDAWLAIGNSALSPFTEDVTMANMDLLTFNTGSGVYATGGVIAGGYDSFYCITCTVATGKAVAHAQGAHLAIETEAPKPSDAPPDTGETPPEETGGEPGTEGEVPVGDPAGEPFLQE